MTAAVAYLRVSSQAQAERDTPIAGQRRAVQQFAHQHGYSLVGEFVDGGRSGRTDARDAFRSMLQAAHKRTRPFDAVLVWKYDRFARNAEDAAVHKAALRRCGVRVVSITEPVTDDPMGRFLERQLDALAELYSEMLGQNTQRGQRENAMRGGWNGGKVPYGYTADRSQGVPRLLPDEQTAPVVAQIYRWCVEGHSLDAIAYKLNEQGHRTRQGRRWTPSSLYPSILKNPRYMGTLVWGRRTENPIAIPDALPALVDGDLYEQAQEALAARRSVPAAPGRHFRGVHLLVGPLACVRCGDRMWGRMGRVRNGTLGPSTYHCRHHHRCPTPHLDMETADAAVIEVLQDYLLHSVPLDALVAQVNEDLATEAAGDRRARLARRRDDLKARRERLIDALEAGDIDRATLGDRLGDLQARLEAAETELVEYTRKARSRPQAVNTEALRRDLGNLETIMAQGTPEERRGVIAEFIPRIDVDWPMGSVSLALGGVVAACVPVDLRGPCPVPLAALDAPLSRLRPLAAKIRTWAKDKSISSLELAALGRDEIQQYCRRLITAAPKPHKSIPSASA